MTTSSTALKSADAQKFTLSKTGHELTGMVGNNNPGKLVLTRG